MMDTSWDHSFVDNVVDDLATQLNRLHRSPSDANATMAASRRGDDGSSRMISVSGGRRCRRRRTLEDVTVSPSPTDDNSGSALIDARCAVAPSESASGTDLAAGTPSATYLDVEEEQSDTIRDAEDFGMSISKSDGDRLYENMPPATTGDRLTVSDWVSFSPVTSSAGSSQAPTPRLLFPDDGMARKASSSSTSSTCDSVLDLSRCSSCCEATAAVSATPVEDAPSLPDSGNGSSEAGIEHFWFPRLLSSDRGNSLDRARLPGGPSSAPYCLVASFVPEWDAERLEMVYGRLAQCGFYYGRLNIDAASERLRRAPVGTFLLRDSADERYLFSISVQTCRGTTSIRMLYHAGLFHLDCSREQEHLMPTFDCALRLVVHYVRVCSDRRRSAGSSYVFLESSGRRDTPVLLRRPLYWRVDRLTHLCRRAVHGALSHGPASSPSDRGAVVDRLQLIPSLKCYLKDYPYEL